MVDFISAVKPELDVTSRNTFSLHSLGIKGNILLYKIKLTIKQSNDYHIDPFGAFTYLVRTPYTADITLHVVFYDLNINTILWYVGYFTNFEQSCVPSIFF